MMIGLFLIVSFLAFFSTGFAQTDPGQITVLTDFLGKPRFYQDDRRLPEKELKKLFPQDDPSIALLYKKAESQRKNGNTALFFIGAVAGISFALNQSATLECDVNGCSKDTPSWLNPATYTLAGALFVTKIVLNNGAAEKYQKVAKELSKSSAYHFNPEEPVVYLELNLPKEYPGLGIGLRF